MPDQPDHPDQPDRPDPRGPEGDPTRPWEQPSGAWPGWQDSGQTPPPQYPRQNLLPQEVKPGRNRKPLFIAIAVVIALVIAGGIAFLVLRDDGEDTREAYCAALRDLTGDGDVMSALSDADAGTADKLQDRDGSRPERRRRRLEEAQRRDLVLAVRLAGHVGGAVALQFPARDRGRRASPSATWTSAYRCCNDAFTSRCQRANTSRDVTVHGRGARATLSESNCRADVRWRPWPFQS